MLEAVAGTVLVMLVYAVVEEEAPRFRQWLKWRPFLRSTGRSARAFEGLAKEARKLGEDRAFNAARYGLSHDEIELGYTSVRLSDNQIGLIIRAGYSGPVAVQVAGEPEARMVELDECQECSPAAVLLSELSVRRRATGTLD